MLRQRLVFRESLQNFGLTQRQADLLMFIVNGDDEVFDLKKGSIADRTLGRMDLTSSPQSSASRSLTLALRQIVRSCWLGVRT